MCMKSGRTKSLKQIREQRDRMLNMVNRCADRYNIINRIFWHYEANILHYMSVLLDTPQTAGDFRWLDINMREKREEVSNTQIDRLIYSYSE